MPLVNRLSNDYDPSAAWASGIRSIGTVMAQMPAIRAMAQQRQAMAEFQRSHAGYEDAAAQLARTRAGLVSAQTDTEKNVSGGHQQFGDALKRLAADPNDTDALGDAFEGAGKGFKTDPQNTMKALGLLLSQVAIRNGSTNTAQIAELQGGAPQLAVADANNAAKAALPANNQATLPAGSTLVSRITGQPVVQAAATIPVGGTRIAPVVGTNTPTVEAHGAPAPPKSTAVDSALAGLVSKLVASGADPSLVSNSVAQFRSALPQPADQDAASVNPPQPKMVRVMHPDGKTTGSIPAANVQAALNQGYKLIQ
jgi:hypothetical protein